MPNNVEIKARVNDLSRLEQKVKAIATTDAEYLNQDDTFFNCANGRLKLRDFGNGQGDLIFYQRADQAGPKSSFYKISRTDDPAGLRETLKMAHGVLGQVRKHRTLYLIDRTRIHLDTVEGLGEFIEFEVVLEDNEPHDAGVQIANRLLAELEIKTESLIEGAYLDLLTQKTNKPQQDIAQVALVVKDYDEAIEFYTQKLSFELLEDTYIAEQDKRWVLLSPPNSSGAKLLLARASTDEQQQAIGKQTGGRVFLFLTTDDFWRDYHNMVKTGIEFVRQPQEHDYGTVAVFKDLYGNLWDLLEYK